MKPPGRAHQRRCAGAVAIALLAIGAAAGCSRGDAAPRGTVIKVVTSDFKLATSVEKVHAGLVTFRVHNLGASTHEFVVDRTNLRADALPLRANGISANEDAKQLHAVGEIGDIRLDTTRELTVSLKPGHYAMYCNLSGHYRGGMYADIEATG
jgi:uncharacterized cupredoxin-like copper-binding protein